MVLEGEANHKGRSNPQYSRALSVDRAAWVLVDDFSLDLVKEESVNFMLIKELERQTASIVPPQRRLTSQCAAHLRQH